MVDLSQAYSEVKSLPDEALARELKSGSGMIPGYLVLGEMQERKALRAGGASSAKTRSMAEEFTGSIEPYVPRRGPATGVAGLPAATQPQGYASGGIVKLANGGSIQDQMWAFYKQKGLADHQVAAIMGNVQAESAFQHAVDTGDGGNAWGLFQWNDRRHKMSSAVPDWKTNPTGQMEFAWREMMGPESRAGNALRNAKTVQEANNAMLGFERPAGFSWDNPQGGHNYAGRLANANKFYQQYTGSAPVAVDPAVMGQPSAVPDVAANVGANIAAQTGVEPTVVQTTPVDGGGGLGDMMGVMQMMQMLNPPTPKPPDEVIREGPAPGPKAPIDPYQVVAMTSVTPNHYRKRNARRG